VSGDIPPLIWLPRCFLFDCFLSFFRSNS